MVCFKTLFLFNSVMKLKDVCLLCVLFPLFSVHSIEVCLWYSQNPDASVLLSRTESQAASVRNMKNIESFLNLDAIPVWLIFIRPAGYPIMPCRTSCDCGAVIDQLPSKRRCLFGRFFKVCLVSKKLMRRNMSEDIYHNKCKLCCNVFSV